MEEREKTKMTPDWFVICLSTPPSTRDVVFSPVYTKTTAFGGWGGPSAVERYLKDTRAKILVNVVVLSPSPPFFLTQI